MATTYHRAPEEVHNLVKSLIEKHHPTIDQAGVKFDLLFAKSNGGPAVKLNGWPCYAVVRIVGPVERAKGSGDAEIRIDAEQYEKMTEGEKAALLDHELHHVVPIFNEAEGEWKRDAYDRPRLKMRPHDVQIGWFTAIAERHGENSIERQQARKMFEENGQALFPFLVETQPELGGLRVLPTPPAKAA